MLNRKSVNGLVIVMFDLMETSKVKLQIFNRDVIFNTFKYFSNTKKFFAGLIKNQIKLN